MSGDCPRIVASGTSCDCVRPCSSKWPEKEFEMDLKQLSREELEIAFYNMHTKNECLSKALKDNVKQIKRLNKIIKKNEEDRRRCLSPTKQLYEDRISQLEQANTFLQDKVLVLRHQLQSHSRLHAKAHRNSSHHSRGIHSTKTSQTHLSHLPIPLDPENINEDGKNDSNENLNVDLAENDSRILQLQNELEQNPSDAAKVAENIEMIRLRRLVKRQTAQLSTMNAHLEMADKELDQLRSSYNEANLENDQVLKQLMSEKQRLREVQNELIELGNLKQDIKILQEQVRDLLSERTLLRSNNDKLLEIASGKAEEDTSQQPKNDTEKEIVEKDTKEESEKIFTNTIEAMGTISQHQMNTILEESLAKKTSREFVKHNLFKKIISKACSTNTYDLGIEPRTEDSLFKAFSHQVLSDIFSKQYFRPSTLNYTIMPLIQASDDSKEEKGDEKKNEDKHNQNISSENDGVPMIANEDDNENLENKRNSELSVDEAKFIFMQLLKNELENYVATSDQVLNSVENEANLTNENNRAENDPRTLIPPSGLVDYFWGMVGYKMFFPKKSLQIIDEAEIREHSEDASIRSNMENYVLSDVSPPYHTISISEKSVGVNDSIEGCILLIENPGNRLNSYWNPNYNEPKFDIESDDSQTIDIFSYRTIDSDLQTNEEPIPGNTEPKSRAEGDASTSNSTRTSVSTKQLSATEGESEMIREMLEDGEIFVIKFEDSDCDPNLSKTLVNDENKDSTAEKSSTSSEHSQAPINESQILNENSTIEKERTGSENSQTPINKSQVLDTNKNSTAKTGRTGLDHNQTPINGSQALNENKNSTAKTGRTGIDHKQTLINGSQAIDENKNSTAKTGRTGLDHNQTPINGSQALDTNKKSTAEKDITGSDRSLTLGDGPQLENGSNKCSCNSSSGAGQYILEELKPDLSRNGADSEENSIKNLPEQEKAAFIVYNLNSGTGSRHKIGVLFLKKIGCECNLKPITERQTRDSQLPFSSKGSEANEVSEKTTRIPEQSENVQSSREPEPDVDFEQIQLNNDEKEMRNPISVDNSFPTSNKQTVQGVSSAPLLTLLRRLLQKIIGEPVSETTGPSFSVIDGDESDNTIYSGSHHEMYDAVIESPNTRYLDSVDSMPDSSNKELFTMSSKQDNNGDNDTNDIVVNSKVSLEPPNESEFFERNSENVVTRQNESFRRSSDPGPSKFVTKTIQTQMYNRVPLDRNEEIVDEYICSSGQTVRKMRGDDNRRQNHDHESTNTHKSANKSPDSKISQTSKVKNYGNPLPTNLARSVNKSPVSKTSQPMNDKNQGKSVEVLKVSSSFRDRSPKKTSKENSVRRYEFRKQPTYQTRDTVSPNRLNQNNSLPGSSGGYHSRCTTPVNNNDEGSRRSPYVQKVQSNQPNNRANKVSVGNSEGSARNTRERYEKHNQAKPIIKVSSTPTPLKPIISSHEREIVNSIKRLIELLDKNLNNNENSSADELLSNDGSGSLYSGRRLAFSIPEGERIGSAKSDSRVSSERGCSSNSSQLSCDQSQPKECPTSLNRKLRLQQLDVSNDSPFSKKGENSKQTNRNDKRSINHEVDRSDPESSRHRPSQPEMIIVVGKKLTIYEEDDKEDEK